MLLRNKIIIIISFLLIINIAYAQQCETSIVKSALKKALFDYLNNPSTAKVPVAEIRDLLKFYLTIAENEITVNCAVQGEETGIKMENIVNEAKSIITALPTCSDGTNYGECSSTKPKYCYNGKLIDKCSLCSCPSGKICQNNACAVPVQNITCTINSDCGSSGPIGNYFCQNNDVYKNYINYTCKNPGTTSSYCSSATMPILIDDCTGSKYCSVGMSTCQVNQTNQTTGCINSDGSVILDSFYIKGTCNDGILHQDYCQGSIIREYWCPTPRDPPVCELWNYDYSCPNGCQDGACISLNKCGDALCDPGEDVNNCPGDCPSQSTCADSDAINGLVNSYYVKGTCGGASNPTFNQDYCEGNVIKEWTCEQPGNVCTLWSYTYTCPNGCQNGTCITSLSNCGNGICNTDETYLTCPSDCSSTGCSDSDGGDNIYKKGITTGANIAGSTSDSCGVFIWDPDYSIQGYQINENYCIGSNVRSATEYCPADYACYDGACVNNLTCSPGYKCESTYIRGYQKNNCYWTDLSFCYNGCVNGACIQNQTTGCVGATKNNVCKYECGAFTSCDSRSSGSEYACNSDKTYNSNGPYLCLCYAEYNCDGRIVQNNSCSSGGVWDSPYSADNICLATCGADQNCNLKFSTFEYRCNADKTPNAYGSYLCDCKPDCKSKIKCEGPLINGVCMLGCGSHQGCSGRSPGSEYRCNSNYLYNGTGSFMCRCGTDCIPVFI